MSPLERLALAARVLNDPVNRPAHDFTGATGVSLHDLGDGDVSLDWTDREGVERTIILYLSRPKKATPKELALARVKLATARLGETERDEPA